MKKVIIIILVTLSLMLPLSATEKNIRDVATIGPGTDEIDFENYQHIFYIPYKLARTRKALVPNSSRGRQLILPFPELMMLQQQIAMPYWLQREHTITTQL